MSRKPGFDQLARRARKKRLPGVRVVALGPDQGHVHIAGGVYDSFVRALEDLAIRLAELLDDRSLPMLRCKACHRPMPYSQFLAAREQKCRECRRRAQAERRRRRAQRRQD
jgi:hypothetical protein